MEELILILLAAVGFSHILVDGSILKPFKNKLDKLGYFSEDHKPKPGFIASFSRWFLEGSSCYQCSATWGGLICTMIYWTSLIECMWWTKIFLYAFAASYLSMLGAVLLMYFNYGGSINEENGTSGNKTSTPN